MDGAALDWTKDLERWLRPFLARLGHKTRRQMCPVYVSGLIGPGDRKSIQPMAERLALGSYDRLHHFISSGVWDAAPVEAELLVQADKLVGGRDAVLVIDETGFRKQGKASCGVARQHTGSAGKITNCQIGVFAAYESRHGHALIDRALYLPKSWADDATRRAAAHVLPEIKFATKPRLAVGMIERAIAAGVPFAWVAADSIYGVGEI